MTVSVLAKDGRYFPHLRLRTGMATSEVPQPDPTPDFAPLLPRSRSAPWHPVPCVPVRRLPRPGWTSTMGAFMISQDKKSREKVAL